MFYTSAPQALHQRGQPRAISTSMVCRKRGGSWLTAGGGSSTKNRLKAKFDIALFHDALDSPVAQIAGQGEDGCGRVAQLSVLLLHPVEFTRLTDGRSFVSPATDLLGIDVHELHLLGVNAVDAVNGSVVHDMRAHRCLGQRLDARARVVQRLVDHAGDERHFADRLPVHRLGMWHGGFLCLGSRPLARRGPSTYGSRPSKPSVPSATRGQRWLVAPARGGGLRSR